MKAKILIIEDNELNLELAVDLLQASQFTVSSASSAEEGMRLAGELAPDLILMDLSLPGIDGLAATQALKNDPATCHLKVIALTAHAMMGDQETALRAGCNGYLTKPINIRTFPRQVAEFLALAH